MSRKNKKTFRPSRKIDAAIIGADDSSWFIRSRRKSTTVSAAKIPRPASA
jgi:hypothetical protein